MRARLASRGEQGVTLMELLLAIVILGIIAVPISTAFIVGLKTTKQANTQLSDGNATILANVFFASDVQNVNTANPVALGAVDCAGNVGDLVLHDVNNVDVTYKVVTISGKVTLTRRSSNCNTSGAQQRIAPGLATSYQLSTASGTLTFYCTSDLTPCPADNYTNLRMVSMKLTTANLRTVELRGTIRT